MADVLAVLQSDTALIGSAFVAFWILRYVSTGGAKDVAMTESFLPVTLVFLNPLLAGIVEIFLYSVMILFAVPFLLTLGFPLFLIFAAGGGIAIQKALGWPLEQSIALSFLCVLILGFGV